MPQIRPCVFSCVTHGLAIHRFPAPKYPFMERFCKWKSILPENIQAKGDTYIYNNIRLCDKHFESFYILPSKQLTRNAVPTLFTSLEVPTIYLPEEYHSTSPVHKEIASTCQCAVKTIDQPLAYKYKGIEKIWTTTEIKNSTTYRKLNVKFIRMREKVKKLRKEINKLKLQKFCEKYDLSH